MRLEQDLVAANSALNSSSMDSTEAQQALQKAINDLRQAQKQVTHQSEAVKQSIRPRSPASPV